MPLAQRPDGQAVWIAPRPRRLRPPGARQVGRLRDREWLDRSEAGESVRTLALLYNAPDRTVRDGIARARALRARLAELMRRAEAEAEAEALATCPAEVPPPIGPPRPRQGRPRLTPGLLRYLRERYGSDPSAAAWLESVAARPAPRRAIRP